MVLFLAKMVAVTLDEVSLGAEFLHSLLGCGSAALAEPGQSGKGNSHIPVLPACQKEQDKGHPLGGVGQSRVGNQIIGYGGDRMQVSHLNGLLSSKFVRLENAQGKEWRIRCPGDIHITGENEWDWWRYRQSF